MVHIGRGGVSIFLAGHDQICYFLQISDVLLGSILKVSLTLLILPDLQFLLPVMVKEIENSLVVDFDVTTAHFKLYFCRFFEHFLVVKLVLALGRTPFLL